MEATLMFKQLGKMPKWVRITTWFVFLFLTVYLYVSPRFVNGQIVLKAPKGGTMDYRGGTLRTQVDGRVFKFQTNEDGFFSVPIVSRLPQDVHLQVFHEDAQSWFDVDFKATDLWRNNLGISELRIVLSNDKPAVEIQSIGQSDYLSNGLSLVAGWLFGNPVMADEKPSVYEIVGDVLGIPAKKVKPTTPISRGAGISYMQRLEIINEVQQAFDIQISDEEFRGITTAGQLQELVSHQRYAQQQ